MLAIILIMIVPESRARDLNKTLQSRRHDREKDICVSERSLSGVPFQLTENGNNSIFFDDFESGPGDWTHGNICKTNGYQWHCSTVNAYEGQSWWCGNIEAGGYLSYWYQVLTTPVINLDSSISTELTFMHYYAIEYDETRPPEESPWDGCHVRISTDGGETYLLIMPDEGYDPPDILWVWEYHAEYLENGMPGWHGFSDGWEKVTFDLSQYSGNQIQLKFIFASDAAWDVRDDARLLGWFIDEIKIENAGSLLYYDDAEDTVIPSRLTRSEGSGCYPTGWQMTTGEYYSSN